MQTEAGELGLLGEKSKTPGMSITQGELAGSAGGRQVQMGDRRLRA